ncbi:MAG: DUF7010 family protein [Micropepsaceae bacterium]
MNRSFASRAATRFRSRGRSIGALYWGALAYVGTMDLPLKTWLTIAFIGSGAIFPLAWGLSSIAGVNFMGDKSAAGSIIGPAMFGMLLFWPMAALAFWTAPDLAVPILAIGMAMHWPVIGWSYGRTALYTAHAVARALIVATLFMLEPDQRLVLIPASVAFVYLATVLGIFIDLPAVARSLKK